MCSVGGFSIKWRASQVRGPAAYKNMHKKLLMWKDKVMACLDAGGHVMSARS